MEKGFDFRSRQNLEQYLQDLVCEVSSMAEVGVLVEVLMELQHRAPVGEPANSRAASPAAGEKSERNKELEIGRCRESATQEVVRKIRESWPKGRK